MRLLIAVVLLLAGGATGDVFGEEVGIAKLVKTWAYLTPDGDRRRPLFQRDGVQAPATIETIDKGALHVRFTDGTDLRLGSASRAQLGEIRVDGRDPSLPLILERGAFRLITGRSPPSAFELTTPTARIRILGTNIIVIVADDGATQVNVYQGEVAVMPVSGGATHEVAEGRNLTVAASGTVSEGSAITRGDSGLNRRGGKGRRGGRGPAPGSTR